MRAGGAALRRGTARVAALLPAADLDAVLPLLTQAARRVEEAADAITGHPARARKESKE
ncbi:hypothetical protein [Nonomuraea guangzhouensis]|uniref:MarR family transcriptional regulator n=1 Tax=Nonomuraea guangzhouensis TaxID=1291555 RepID=A0ABW4GHZ4_9ACTN|nr:hypothetical protein [Nonomuraea guangzhouensis]